MLLAHKLSKAFHRWLIFFHCLVLMVISSTILANDHFLPDGTLHLPIQVKETAGVNVGSYPVSVVVPLPQGRYQETSSFKLIDAQGNTIPTQIEIVNRWWSADNSLRHIKIYFTTSVSAFSTSNTGITNYTLTDEGSTATTSNLTVTSDNDRIEVNTGPLRFTINKRAFNLLDQVWLDKNNNGQFESSESMLDSSANRGGKFTGRLVGDIQFDKDRADVVVEIEEIGSERVVIKAQASTLFYDTENHQHGFAVRIYAYANQPFVKIDYQLQNSSKLTKFSWPLYFNALDISLPLFIENSPTITVGTDGVPYSQIAPNGVELAQTTDSSFEIRNTENQQSLFTGTRSTGYIDVRSATKGVTGIIRNFWQTWANGLKVDQENVLSLQLFPKWSSQWEQTTDPSGYQLSNTGLYWLQDMQHVYKETMINFHDGNQPINEIEKLAKLFQSYPIVTLPTAWYQYTKATLDMGGNIPRNQKHDVEDLRQDSYKSSDYQGHYYGFNWLNFGSIEPGGRVRACAPGGWPTNVSKFITTENPRDYFIAERYGQGEINVRPQWITSYNHETDFERLKLTENGYCDGTWRAFDGHDAPSTAAPLLPNTANYWGARDDQHAWFYHVEQSYYFTGNLWIKDWYDFIAEFRRIKMLSLDPFPDSSTRGKGHPLSNVLQAYRITGDQTLIANASAFLSEQITNLINVNTGGMHTNTNKDASFATGYLTRAIISYMEEVKYSQPQEWAEAFQALTALMNWNYQYCHYCDYISTVEPINSPSSYNGSTLVDSVAWYGWTTGQTDYINQLQTYINEGLNGGVKPYGDYDNWQGTFVGRTYRYFMLNPKADQTAPEAITNLAATLDDQTITFSWTVPLDAVRSHLIWSQKPIKDITTFDFDDNKTNWFSANVIGQHVENSNQSATITAPKGMIYAAAYSFDAAGNISKISNKIMQEGPADTSPPTTPPEVDIDTSDTSQVSLNWPDSTDDVGVQGYKIYRDGVEIAFVTTSEFVDDTTEYGKTYVYSIVAVDNFGNESNPLVQTVSFIAGSNASPIIIMPIEFTLTQGEFLNLDASASHDINSANGSDPIVNPNTHDGYDNIVKFQWDLDNDGIFGAIDNEPENMNIEYDFNQQAGNYNISVKVTDSFGAASIQTIKVLVYDQSNQVVRFAVTQDVTLDGYSAQYKSMNFGGSDIVRLWSNGERRAAVKALIELPDNIEIIEAKMHLFVTEIRYPNNPKVTVYSINRDWKEGQGTYGNATSGATWYEHDAFDHNDTTANNWNEFGGDYDQQSDFGHGANGILDQVTPEANQWLSIDISTITTQWLKNLENNGLILIGENSGNAIHFASKEHNNTELHPYIEIRYQVIDPNPPINFNQLPMSSFGKEQDNNSNITISQTGKAVTLSKNQWKKFEFKYSVTANTLLTFDFIGYAAADIQAIGFSTTNTLNESQIFQLTGQQSLGHQYQIKSADGELAHTIHIPLGQYILGDIYHIVMINDQDNQSVGSAQFSNIRLIELENDGPKNINFVQSLIADTSPVEALVGSTVVSNNTQLTLSGNQKAHYPYSYNITKNTYLAFTVSSDEVGILHTIGFNNLAQSNEETSFQLAGSQQYGYQVASQTTDHTIPLQDIIIPIGEYFNGKINFLNFINLHAQNEPAAFTSYSNIRLYENEE